LSLNVIENQTVQSIAYSQHRTNYPGCLVSLRSYYQSTKTFSVSTNCRQNKLSRLSTNRCITNQCTVPLLRNSLLICLCEVRYQTELHFTPTRHNIRVTGQDPIPIITQQMSTEQGTNWQEDKCKQ
jgi:hypothetical protein